MDDNKNNNNLHADVIIIGAGPIGLELAVSLKEARVSYIHLEANQIGHTISWYPNQARFFSRPERISIAGVALNTPDQTKATKEQYLAYLRGVVQQFDLDIKTYQRVENIKKTNNTFYIQARKPSAAAANNYSAKHLVMAVGDMHEPRLLDIPGENLPHVSHYFNDPHPYFRKKVLIVGGRNSAAEAALRCYHAGADVSISYRRDKFPESIKYWILPELNSLIEHKRIKFYPNSIPVAIYEDTVALASSEFNQGKNPYGENITIDADFALLLTGYQMKNELLKMAGIQLEGENQAPKLDNTTMMSNVKNLYVAGTATAGTQIKFKSFIETSHAHVARIIKAITGKQPKENLVNPAGKTFDLPES